MCVACCGCVVYECVLCVMSVMCVLCVLCVFLGCVVCEILCMLCVWVVCVVVLFVLCVFVCVQCGESPAKTKTQTQYWQFLPNSLSPATTKHFSLAIISCSSKRIQNILLYAMVLWTAWLGELPASGVPFQQKFLSNMLHIKKG